MSSEALDTKIKQVVDAWNGRFGDLQKRQNNGESVGEEDVRTILVQTGREIYESGLIGKRAVADVALQNQFDAVLTQVSNRRFTHDEMSGNERLNALQIAHLESTFGPEKEAYIASLETDPDYLPEPSNATSQAVDLAPETTVSLTTQTIEQNSAQAARDLLKKLAPPDSFTTGVSDNASEMHEMLDDKLFSVHPDAKPSPMGPAVASGGTYTDNDDEQAISMGMPVKVVQPLGAPDDIPKDVLGRIIH